MSFVISKIYDALLARSERLCLADWRHGLVSSLAGSVLEIGSGTGRNLEHYSPTLTRLVLAEPNHHMRKQLTQRIRACKFDTPVELCDSPAERLDFADASFDTIVSTLVLCSVADVEQSVREVHRLLRPGGQFILIEHILAAPGSRRRRWQQRLNPLWSRCSNGCQLNRDPRPALEYLGFRNQQQVLAELRGAPDFLRTVLRGRWEKPAAQ